jgi:hypothetical protein
MQCKNRADLVGADRRARRSIVAGIGDPGRDEGRLQNASWPASPMPDTDIAMHKHLRRLERVWIHWPIYFITTCTFRRRAILASNEVAGILIHEWAGRA